MRTEIEKRIARKRDEIARLQAQVREAEIYISALEDTLKLLPRDGVNEGGADTVLRPNSIGAKARQLILERRRPMHVQALLAAMGRPDSRTNRSALTGSLAAYVRKGEIFTRPAPNTFSLVELADSQRQRREAEPEPPEGFGIDAEVATSLGSSVDADGPCKDS